MMECVEEFVDSEVLKAVHQRTDKVKIARMAKVEEMEAAATVAAAVKMDHKGCGKPNGVMCEHEGCVNPIHCNGVCREHGEKC